MSADRIAHLERQVTRIARIAALNEDALPIFERLDSALLALRAEAESKRKTDPVARARALLQVRRAS